MPAHLLRLHGTHPAELLLGGFLGTSILDLASKALVLRWQPVISIPPGLIEIRVSTNTDLAFGPLGRLPASVSVPLAVVAFLIACRFLLARLQGREAAELLGFGLFLGGALANILGTLWVGSEVDWVQIHIGQYVNTGLNVAEIFLGTGVGLIAWQRMRELRLR